MAEVEDVDAADDFLQSMIEQDPAEEEQRTYEDTEYYVVDGSLSVGIIDESAFVFGSETGLMLAVDAAAGESLAESDEYTERLDELPDDPLASLFVEPAAAIEASIASGDVEPAGRAGDRAAARRPALAADGGHADGDDRLGQRRFRLDGRRLDQLEHRVLAADRSPGGVVARGRGPRPRADAAADPRSAHLQRPPRHRRARAPRAGCDRARPRRRHLRLARRRGRLHRGHRGARIQRRTDRPDQRSGGAAATARGASGARRARTPGSVRADRPRAPSTASRSGSRGSAAGPRPA